MEAVEQVVIDRCVVTIVGYSTDETDSGANRRARHASEGSSTKSFLILGLIFLASLLALGVVYLNFPKLDQ